MATRALRSGPERSRDEQFVGRCRELAVLHAQLGRVCEGRSGLVVLEGPAGIGKTALAGEFLCAIENAVVLEISGDEGESELPYGVLGQLGAQVQQLPDALAGLAGPGAQLRRPLSDTPAGGGTQAQRLPDALAGRGAQAQGLPDAPAGRGAHVQRLPDALAGLAGPGVFVWPDPLVVGAGLLELLAKLQQSAPVVVAIDGADWADLPSLQALTFALRRLRTDRVLAIMIVREDDHPRLPDGLRRLLRSSAALRLPIGGLSARELQALSARLGPVRLTPQAAERLHEHTKGVPLHARALLQQVRAETLADVDAPLPAPRAYTTLVLGRLGQCDPAAQRLLTAAAVLGTSAPLHLVARMAELAEPLPVLEQVTGAGLLVEWRTAAGVSVGFPNPLVRAAIYHDLGPATRRRLHLLAAELVGDVVHRLHHRLAAADQVDGELVREVALVGRRQAAAGRWSSACGCLTRAVQLTGEGPERDRLIAEAVEALLAAGRPVDAGALAGQVAPGGDPAVRDYVLGSVALVAGRVEEAVRRLDHAWSQAKGDGRLRAGVAARQAMAALLRGRGPDAAHWAECALTTPPPAPHPPDGDRPSKGARLSDGHRLSVGAPPSEGDRPSDGHRPAGRARPSEEDRPSDGHRPVRGARPAEGGRFVGGDRPAEGGRPARGVRPAEGDRPLDGDRVSGVARSSGGGRPLDGVPPSAGEQSRSAGPPPGGVAGDGRASSAQGELLGGGVSLSEGGLLPGAESGHSAGTPASDGGRSSRDVLSSGGEQSRSVVSSPGGGAVGGRAGSFEGGHGVGGELVRFAWLVGAGLAGRVEEGVAACGELPVPGQASAGELGALLGRGVLRLWADDLAGAQADLLGLLAVGADRSAPFQLLVAVALAQAEYRLGRWDEAVGHAEVGVSTADDFGQAWLASYAHAVAALVPAARGEWERATTHVRAARAACSPDNASAQVSTAAAEALVATARGDHDAAVTALMPLTRTNLPDEPVVVLWRTLLADALVNAGRPEEADAVLVPCELLALDKERRSVLAAAARARAGLHAARHEPVEAETCYQVALEHTAKVDMPFEEARIQLAYGTFLRRRGRRSAAAEQLEAAQLTLSRLGALPYLEQCDLELAASGRAVLRPQDTARLGLTPQEHTVAVLISRGLTNRQAARKLVLSVKTVEYHLSHIYTKLGITSRTALIGRLSDLGE
ncbi:AAA family ATPase [Nonomuraea sp. NPDC049709]|uniref:helix-turn-helix transcriptional regulator n=1 Tax=Nonomuraea sp. NPDC049709 TaxID=3154736 RepID=UPI00341FF3F1